ncbi:MAG: hypothetical protein KF809_14855 [Chloroflexi bacterium]|nr:hypothetical protein [Chloroflexota bacterium]
MTTLYLPASDVVAGTTAADAIARIRAEDAALFAQLRDLSREIAELRGTRGAALRDERDEAARVLRSGGEVPTADVAVARLDARAVELERQRDIVRRARDQVHADLRALIGAHRDEWRGEWRAALAEAHADLADLLGTFQARLSLISGFRGAIGWLDHPGRDPNRGGVPGDVPVGGGQRVSVSHVLAGLAAFLEEIDPARPTPAGPVYLREGHELPARSADDEDDAHDA